MDEMMTMGDMMGMGGWMGMGVWMLLWVLIGLAVLGLAIAGIVYLVRRSDAGRAPSSAWQRESPEDVLRRRYAAGEMDDEEFYRRMAALSDRSR